MGCATHATQIIAASLMQFDQYNGCVVGERTQAVYGHGWIEIVCGKSESTLCSTNFWSVSTSESFQELHIRLERNHSSPLIGGHSSPALSSRLSSNCPSAEPPTDPAEPEDLEVQFINECFEEQQRQSQMYQSGDLKTLFYHGSSELDSSKVANRSGTDKSGQSSLERPERLPYAKKLSSHDPLSSVTNYESLPITSPTFLNLSDNFEPLLTPKSEALIQKRVWRDQKASPSRRRVSEPLAQKPPLFWGSGSTPISDCATPDSVRCEDETEALAKGVIESLFSGVALTPLTPAEDFKEELRKASTTSKQNKAVRKLYMDNLVKSDSSEKSTKDLFPVVDLNKSSAEADKLEFVVGLSDVSGQSSSQAKSVDVASSIPEEPVVMGDDDGDSWENLDDTKLEEQVVILYND
ncbi:hypothetical protein TELCIR_05445 [Teladorsagia circumcincta]|uniref:Uncharacterized protein n=1 Tax=Teladorsagia circumcincta TaxID=45464 RepID=A0A2G9UQT6_TELCI|nr:hypothetical protein TELCIR_05445 [Teladorsagia circumcincta]